MKTLAFALFCLALVTMPAAAQSPTKIGYINSQKLIDQAPGSAEVKTTLQKELASYKAQIDAMDDSLSTMISDLNKQSVLLSPDAKQKKQEDITAKRAAFTARADEMQGKATQRQQQLLQPIMDKIKATIEEVRKSEGYAIIFDSATEAMVAADTTLDLTDKIIAKLKAPVAAAPGKN
jgi:outer membrane protein